MGGRGGLKILTQSYMGGGGVKNGPKTSYVIYGSSPMEFSAHPPRARALLERVQGHLVFLPLMFLVEENLQPNIGTKESLVPTQIWT